MFLRGIGVKVSNMETAGQVAQALRDVDKVTASGTVLLASGKGSDECKTQLQTGPLVLYILVRNSLGSAVVAATHPPTQPHCQTSRQGLDFTIVLGSSHPAGPNIRARPVILFLKLECSHDNATPF